MRPEQANRAPFKRDNTAGVTRASPASVVSFWRLVPNVERCALRAVAPKATHAWPLRAASV